MLNALTYYPAGTQAMMLVRYASELTTYKKNSCLTRLNFVMFFDAHGKYSDDDHTGNQLPGIDQFIRSNYPEECYFPGPVTTPSPTSSPSQSPTPSPTPIPTPTASPPTETMYEFYNVGRDSGRDIDGTIWAGQTFTPTIIHTLTKIKLELAKIGSPSTLTCSLRNTSGGLPIGNDLASASIQGSDVSTVWNWVWIDLPDWGPFTAGTKYAIVCRCPGCNSLNKYYWGTDNTNPTYAKGSGFGSFNSGTSWISGTRDFMFEEWGYSR